MLPDFRFFLGATLALAVLAVTGLGLVASVQLVREARMNPIEDARSLAFAGHAQWNQFYDPDGARRFEGSGGGEPLAEARLETPPEATEILPPATAPVLVPPERAPEAPRERTASVPAHQPDPDTGVAVAPRIADDTPPATDPPGAVPPATAEAPVAETIVAPSPAPAIDQSVAPAPDRVASAPALVSTPDLRQPPQAGPPPDARAPTEATIEATVDPLRNPPTPRARPKPFRRRIVRAHIRRFAPASQQQITQNAGFPASTSWPGYDNQFSGTTAATKRNAGRLSGTLPNRPQ